MVIPLDFVNHIVSTTFPINFLGCTVAHVESVKHTGLACFGHSLDLFVTTTYCRRVARRRRRSGLRAHPWSQGGSARGGTRKKGRGQEIVM